VLFRSPDIFPYHSRVKARLQQMYDLPGAPDWSNPGFVKKLERMRDHGRLINPYSY